MFIVKMLQGVKLTKWPKFFFVLKSSSLFPNLKFFDGVVWPTEYSILKSFFYSKQKSLWRINCPKIEYTPFLKRKKQFDLNAF